MLNPTVTHTVSLVSDVHSFYTTQRKTLEINPRHPLIKELHRRVEEEEHDETTIDIAKVLYDTAVLRSGYALKDSVNFARRIETMMRLGLGVDLSAEVRALKEIVERERERESFCGRPTASTLLHLVV